ncbi:hypothetical protein VPH35_117638 [Triticum aestivum]
MPASQQEQEHLRQVASTASFYSCSRPAPRPSADHQRLALCCHPDLARPFILVGERQAGHERGGDEEGVCTEAGDVGVKVAWLAVAAAARRWPWRRRRLEDASLVAAARRAMPFLPWQREMGGEGEHGSVPLPGAPSSPPRLTAAVGPPAAAPLTTREQQLCRRCWNLYVVEEDV